MGRKSLPLSKRGDKSLDVVAVIDIQVVQTHRFKEFSKRSVSAAAQRAGHTCHRGLRRWTSDCREDDDKRIAVQLAGNVQI